MEGKWLIFRTNDQNETAISSLNNLVRRGASNHHGFFRPRKWVTNFFYAITSLDQSILTFRPALPHNATLLCHLYLVCCPSIFSSTIHSPSTAEIFSLRWIPYYRVNFQHFILVSRSIFINPCFNLKWNSQMIFARSSKMNSGKYKSRLEQVVTFFFL